MSKRSYEQVAWGGPIVMNTKEELNKAFNDLRFRYEKIMVYPYIHNN
ncbi:MAG: hypothetical protein KA807_16405 [Prolixibacteraceae bacterium]|nr:hypothetical protein [Prolixibacteraceae bacterium]